MNSVMEFRTWIQEYFFTKKFPGHTSRRHAPVLRKHTHAFSPGSTHKYFSAEKSSGHTSTTRALLVFLIRFAHKETKSSLPASGLAVGSHPDFTRMTIRNFSLRKSASSQEYFSAEKFPDHTSTTRALLVFLIRFAHKETKSSLPASGLALGSLPKLTA